MTLGLPQALEQYVIPVTECGCWVWMGAVDWDNYGVAWNSALKRNARAHRLVYEILVGPIPKDLKLLHRCDNPCCVNPDHMFIGTTADNNADMRAKKRHGHGETHGMNKISAEKVAEINAATGTHQEIADRFGVSKSTVTAVKSGRLWKHLPISRTEKSPKAAWRLTPEQIQEIKDSTGSQREIAERFSVHPSLISRIKSGNRHVKSGV